MTMVSSSFGLGLLPATAQEQQQQQPELSIDSSTPWVAVSDGNLTLLQTSLSRLNLQETAADENGYTLLQAAASYSQIQILQWLWDQANKNGTASVMINAVDNEGDSALHYSSTKEAAEFLVHHGINVNIKNEEEKTALQCKQEELSEAIEEEDRDEEDEEFVNLKHVVAYLNGLDSISQ